MNGSLGALQREAGIDKMTVMGHTAMRRCLGMMFLDLWVSIPRDGGPFRSVQPAIFRLRLNPLAEG